MKKLNKIVIVIQVMACIGMPATVLADPGQPNQTTKTTDHGGFAASQFKLDMILAKRGDADAQYYVGTAYEEGHGTQKDLKQAFHWYSKAAQQNQSEAQFKLGYFYEHGLSVKRNMNEAMRWYKLATQTSHGTVRARLHQEAFADRTDENAKARAEIQAKQEKERLQTLERERERERQYKLAQERARQEAAYKQRQLAAAQRHKSVAVSTPRANTVERVNIPDITDVVLKNNWYYGSTPADYLPSSNTHCLRSSGSEIVCFSDEKHRVINGQRVTYTTKATLTGFKPDGTFQIRYYYNAIQMDKAPNQGVSLDPSGLRLVKGWQEPELVMNCRTVDRVNLYCIRGSYRLQYRH